MSADARFLIFLLCILHLLIFLYSLSLDFIFYQLIPRMLEIDWSNINIQRKRRGEKKIHQSRIFSLHSL